MGYLKDRGVPHRNDRWKLREYPIRHMDRFLFISDHRLVPPSPTKLGKLEQQQLCSMGKKEKKRKSKT
jgi:hypothetical protein